MPQNELYNATDMYPLSLNQQELTSALLRNTLTNWYTNLGGVFESFWAPRISTGRLTSVYFEWAYL